jgi:hypothetical protein
MRYERAQVFGALLSVLSVVATLGLSVFDFSDGRSGIFPVVASIAAVLAATAAYTTIVWSRRLVSAREKKQVFLIYAREDLPEARRITEFLRARGYHPWLDVDNITPGEVWKKAILGALEESAVALVLVSDHLINKTGFVHVELRTALRVLQEAHRNVSPLIPVRLDNSQVPDTLSDLQWVNLFEPDGFERLDAGLRRITA